MVDCALHWEIWGMAIQDGRLVDRVMASMPAEIQVIAAADRHRRWTDKIMTMPDGSERHPQLILEAYERLKPPVEASFQLAFTGQPGQLQQFVEKLSACRNP